MCKTSIFEIKKSGRQEIPSLAFTLFHWKHPQVQNIQTEDPAKLKIYRLGMASTNFQFLINELLDSFVVFMQNKRVRMTCQNMALKHIPSIIPHLTYNDVYSSDDLT